MHRSLIPPAALCILIISMIATGCRDNPTSPGGLAGTYRSTIFVKVAPADGPDSAHLRGDFVEATLQSNGTVISKECSVYSAFGVTTSDTNTYTGTYAVRNDSVFFTMTPIGSALAVHPFRRAGNDLHTLPARGFDGPWELYLKRR